MTAAAPANSAARGALRMDAMRRGKTRSFVTPEGVDLSLEIASAGLRFGGLVIDLVLMLLILIGFSLLIGFGVGAAGFADTAAIVWLLGFFLLRNFWFIGFELGPRAATPGKRLVGTRVVARDGGRLTVSSVVARNFVREMEMFLPLGFIAGASGQDMVNSGMVVSALLWTGAMSFFLLFNRDRMRLGDIIGGTWVVLAKRAKVSADLAATAPAEASTLTFTREELSVYGVFELQELERVLRRAEPKQMLLVADTIRGKIGRPIAEDDQLFLTAYYRQLKDRLERDLLFGKRRANKYESAS